MMEQELFKSVAQDPEQFRVYSEPANAPYYKVQVEAPAGSPLIFSRFFV